MSATDLLSGLVGSSLIFWIVIGAIAHARWIQKLLKTESLKITTQNLAIEQNGYTAIKSSNRRFYAKRGFVYGYWDSKAKSVELTIESQESPKIFDVTGINLIAFTSIFFLIALSKGLFNIIGVS
jgi:5-bromo-4-chloroindolyl phosphate hydrolysis protein